MGNKQCWFTSLTFFSCLLHRRKVLYPTNCCRKIKILKLGPHELAGADMLSCRFLIQSILWVWLADHYHVAISIVITKYLWSKLVNPGFVLHTPIFQMIQLYILKYLGKWRGYMLNLRATIIDLKAIFLQTMI